jgi:hypothetical protein
MTCPARQRRRDLRILVLVCAVRLLRLCAEVIHQAMDMGDDVFEMLLHLRVRKVQVIRLSEIRAAQCAVRQVRLVARIGSCIV